MWAYWCIITNTHLRAKGTRVHLWNHVSIPNLKLVKIVSLGSVTTSKLLSTLELRAIHDFVLKRHIRRLREKVYLNFPCPQLINSAGVLVIQKQAPCWGLRGMSNRSIVHLWLMSSVIVFSLKGALGLKEKGVFKLPFSLTLSAESTES